MGNGTKCSSSKANPSAVGVGRLRMKATRQLSFKPPRFRSSSTQNRPFQHPAQQPCCRRSQPAPPLAHSREGGLPRPSPGKNLSISNHSWFIPFHECDTFHRFPSHWQDSSDSWFQFFAVLIPPPLSSSFAPFSWFPLSHSPFPSLRSFPLNAKKAGLPRGWPAIEKAQDHSGPALAPAAVEKQEPSQQREERCTWLRNGWND